MKFRSLKTKVLFWFGTVTTIILLIFNFAIYRFMELNTKLSIQNNLYNKAVFINNKIMDSVPVNELLKEEKLQGVDVAIIKEEKIIFKKGDISFKDFVKFQDSQESFFVFNKGESLDGLYILRIANPFKGAILFYEHNVDQKIDEELQKIKKVLMILEPILLLLLIFLASKMTDKILRSIRNITNTANKIYVTDLTQEIPAPKYDDEIKDLVDSFNGMLSRLGDGVQTLEQFNSDVSHELKTPLTVIKGEIEITLNKKRDCEYYIKSLKTIEHETQQIQEIVDNLLLLTKYSKENISQTFQETHLDSLLLDVIGNFDSILKEKGILLDIERCESVKKDVNQILIKTIFSNILDNAIKYSGEGKNITVSLFEKKEKIFFIVKDKGIGIPQEQIEKIMDRFYRVDESRNKKVKGFGLGLSIVKNGVELHGGEIKISSEENQGTTVKVIL